MSYTVLARKWRPQNFQQMVGQEHVLKALVNALDRQQLHHAYLFTGTRGVGKTSIARIFAKSLNCEAGISSSPCGVCRICTEITEGRHLDLIEVDAASKTKVEDTRELLENIQYMPSSGRFKIYLIDEVHMLSTHSFNALLKTLEEPPPHIKFLLATTDPHKLPATVLSRCLQFHLKNLPPEKVVAYLRDVLKQEAVACDESALWQIGRAADGSMRNALSLTDQAIAFGAGEVRDADVRSMLGNIDQHYVYDVLTALNNHNGRDVLRVVAEFVEHSLNYLSVLDELISLLHRIAVAQVVPEAIDNSLGDRDKIIDLAAQIPAEDIQLFYQIGLQGKQEFPYVPDPRSALEMTLLRMLAFRPEGVLALPESSLSEQTPTEAAASAKKSEAVSAPVIRHREKKTADNQQSSAAPSQKPDRPAPPLECKPIPQRLDNKMAMAMLYEAAELPAAPEAIKPDHWVSLFRQLPLTGVERSVASHCVLLASTADEMKFVLEEKHSNLYNNKIGQRITAALTKYFQKPVTAVINPGLPERESPAAYQSRIAQEQQQQAIENVRQDPNIRLLIDQFSGELDMGSIRPVIKQ